MESGDLLPGRFVLAALDATPAARPVLDASLRLGELTGSKVMALHVSRKPSETLERLAERSGVPLSLVSGHVEVELLRAAEEPKIVGVVLGARATAGGKRPVGHTTMGLIRAVAKPVVIVPPRLAPRRPWWRLLVPLEGVEEDSLTIMESLSALVLRDTELLVLHVFTDETLPRMLDRPLRDLDILATEFTARHLPEAHSIQVRTGPVGPRVIEVSLESDVDLVVLGWSQVTSGERAKVIREVLGASSVPILLLPLDHGRSEGRYEDCLVGDENSLVISAI